jgi:hypothetical protein
MNILNMLSQNMHLVIIGIYAYVLLFHVKENEYMTMLLLTGATCMAICYLKKKSLRIPTIEGQANQHTCSSVKSSEGDINEPLCSIPSNYEGFDNNEQVSTPTKVSTPAKELVRQVAGNMSAYDGLCLQTGNSESWMKTPSDTGLIPNDNLFAFLSSQGPLKPVFTDNSALTGPPIDGQEGSDKKMFMLANNRSSPNCCPSTFTTSTGCMCTTKEQRDFISSRGNNDPGNTGDL